MPGSRCFLAASRASAAAPEEAAIRSRLRVLCRGAVQGVGFRPSVHRLATELELAGCVRNTPEGVAIEVEGEADTVATFPRRLVEDLPPLARIDHMESIPIPVLGERGFVVEASTPGRRAGALVPPDAALCAACRRELDDPSDRRFHYPFTTCTDCGPRFSLVHELPYDRERTAMACFPLCPACRAEYEDPSHRRFHAEPVCCPNCGPRLWLTGSDGTTVAEGSAAIAEAQNALLGGAVLAVKALGGFQLACRADRTEVVTRLRERKRRPTKPFAIMVRDLEEARSVVTLEAADEALLGGPRSPVLLAPRRPGQAVAPEVAPGLADLGVMLPTTPLHVELMRRPDMPPLVMTSANLSEEPICRGNREALARLSGIADGFLLHDRDVVRRVDDSVVRSTPRGPLMIRRARGFVPDPLPLPVRAPRAVLALGGHLQATACLAVGGQAFSSQHVGDLDSEPARAFLREVAIGLEEFLQTEATVLACDLHPDYPSTWLAEELATARGGRVTPVQHHLAHAAAVLAEHGAFPGPDERAVGVCLDGTGWGPDGTAWGGEWLELDGGLRWRRLSHLEPLSLVGGELAVREPWRVAVAALALAGEGALVRQTPLGELVSASRRDDVARLAVGSWPQATGAGRLFEAAAAILGLSTVNTFEGEAAARLEATAATVAPAEPWAEVAVVAGAHGPVLPSRAILATAARRVAAGEHRAAVAAGVHATFAALAAEITAEVTAPRSGVVAIGGGCMVNRLLLTGLCSRLEAVGLRVLTACRLPPGDGGLSYGQAVLAAVGEARSAALSCEDVSR